MSIVYCEVCDKATDSDTNDEWFTEDGCTMCPDCAEEVESLIGIGEVK